MPIVTWSPEFSVGVDGLDADHRQLVGTLNDVFDALLRGNGSLATHKALEDLDVYVRGHFSREEAWLFENASPEYETHRKEHQALCDHIRRVQDMHEQYDQESTIELLVVLRDWLLGHIMNSDRDAISHGCSCPQASHS